jgi:hypothetical protein
VDLLTSTSSDMIGEDMVINRSQPASPSWILPSQVGSQLKVRSLRGPT